MTDQIPSTPGIGRPKRNLWQRLVEPSSQIQSIETRRQARLLASLLIILLPLVMIGATASLLAGSDLAGAVVQAVTVVGIVVAYILCRTRYYQAAAAITLVTFSAVPYGVAFGMRVYAYDELVTSFTWIVLPILLSGVLVTVRGIILLGAANLVATLLVPVLRPDIPFGDMLFSLGVLVTVTALTALMARHRDLLERDRRAEILEGNAQLSATQVELQERNELLHSAVQRYDAYLASVGRGDLVARLVLEQKQRADPLNQLGQRLNETTGSLHEAIVRIRETARQINTAAAEILATSTQQADGVAEQSAAISQTSTTIDEVRTIATQTAQRAQGVASLAQRTAEVSQSGQQAVGDTVASMDEVKRKVETIATGILALSEQAQAIGGIIAAVSDIAAQSNMLALNAAVEAARAGEAGRGFAVVASEVRALAEQSRAATAQVKEILTEIQRGVNTAVMLTEEGMKGADAGVRIAGQAGVALQRLAEGVRESAQAALQIAAAAGQQEAGMAQIAQAMAHIHQVTTQSTVGIRQIEHAVGQLNDLAGELEEQIEPYKL
jgi:methyl-accepting chemotaxis protein